jgi:LysR family hydrogen peroxide-inducible transcriptional activator
MGRARYEGTGLMNFTQIKYFLAVAETLNFTRAAEFIAVSQPALSKAIRKLEEDLGADLLDRTSQQVSLTSFGHRMRAHFEKIDENLRRARLDARSAAGLAHEELNVGILCTVGPGRLGPFLHQFRLTHPGVEIILHDVVPDNAADLLLAGALDVVFCAQEARHDPRFQAANLYADQMVVIFPAGHDFANQNAVTLAEIAGQPYLDRLHCEFREGFFEATKASGLQLDVAMRSEREDWITALIDEGAGVSVMSEDTALLCGVQYRPLQGMTATRRMEIITAASRPPAGMLAAFWDAATEYEWPGA